MTDSEPKLHYHIFMGAAAVPPMASTKIEDYDESIKQFMSLSKSIWGLQDISFYDMLEASDFGEAESMTLGTHKLCIQWHRCPGRCTSPSWN